MKLLKLIALLVSSCVLAHAQLCGSGTLIPMPIGVPGTFTCKPSSSAGTVTSVGLAGTTNQITVTGATPITGSGSWTLTLPSGLIFPGTVTFAAGTTGAPSVTIPSGVAPTTPTTGMFWNQSGALKFHDGTAVRTLLNDNSAAGGDATGTFGALTLATVNANTGTFGSSTQVPQITVNAKGLITAASNVGITAGTGNAPNTVTVTFSATPTFNCGSATAATITHFIFSTAITANITSSSVSTCTPNQDVDMYFVQDGTGGRTFAAPTNWDSCTLDPRANAATLCMWRYDGTNGRLMVQAPKGTAYLLQLAPEIAAPTTGAGATSACPAGDAANWFDSTAHIPEHCENGGTADPYVVNSSSGYSTLTDGATITWAIGSVLLANAKVTLGGSRTLNLTGLVNGGSYVLQVIQDATGSRGLTLGTGCTWKVSGGGAGAITPSTAANAIDVLTFTYDGTNCLANFNKNFS